MQDLQFIQADYDFEKENWVLNDDQVEQVPKEALRIVLKELRPLKRHAPNMRGWVQNHRGSVMIIVTLGQPLAGRAWPVYHSKHFRYVMLQSNGYTPAAMASNFFERNRQQLCNDLRELLRGH